MMRGILVVAALLLIAGGLLLFFTTESAIHQVIAGIGFCTGVVLLAVIELLQLGDSLAAQLTRIEMTLREKR